MFYSQIIFESCLFIACLMVNNVAIKNQLYKLFIHNDCEKYLNNKNNNNK